MMPSPSNVLAHSEDAVVDNCQIRDCLSQEESRLGRTLTAPEAVIACCRRWPEKGRQLFEQFRAGRQTAANYGDVTLAPDGFGIVSAHSAFRAERNGALALVGS